MLLNKDLFPSNSREERSLRILLDRPNLESGGDLVKVWGEDEASEEAGDATGETTGGEEGEEEVDFNLGVEAGVASEDAGLDRGVNDMMKGVIIQCAVVLVWRSSYYFPTNNFTI